MTSGGWHECASSHAHASLADLAKAMSAEGLRLMFPLAALHAALWPFLWVVVWSLDLPFAVTSLPSHWHARKCWSAPLEARF